MSELVRTITARDPELRNRPLEAFCRSADAAGLLAECEALERFRRSSDNLYERVREQFFLYEPNSRSRCQMLTAKPTRDAYIKVRMTATCPG